MKSIIINKTKYSHTVLKSTIETQFVPSYNTTLNAFLDFQNYQRVIEIHVNTEKKY